MTYCENSLNYIKKKIARKKELELKLNELKLQKKKLYKDLNELETALIKEQEDVKKLESISISAIIAHLRKNKEERLAAEKAEAYYAKSKYDIVVTELSDIDSQIKAVENSLKQLSKCEEDYKNLLQQKMNLIKESNNDSAKKIFSFEEEIHNNQNEIKEIKEAVLAAQNVFYTTGKMLSYLKEAQGFATWDVIGGGLISDLAKHENIDKAKNMLSELQLQIKNIKTELSDISISTDIDIDIDDFLKFADFFFDNIFIDWSVMSHIENSQKEIENTRQKIESLLDKLNKMLNEKEKNISNINLKIKEIVENTSI